MPLYDLSGAKPIEGFKSRGRRRTLDVTDLPPGLPTYGGGGRGSAFAAGRVTPLTGDFIGRNVSADQDLFGNSIRLRARARTLAVDNALFAKFLAEVEQNVIGEHGIQLQAKVTNDYGKQTAETKRINLRIEQEWKRWGRLGSCTACGGYSWVDLQRMAIRTCAAEGESLMKHVLGGQFNDSCFALQLLDNDQLDDTMMQVAAGPDGNEVRMGVEIDGYGRPQAYHLWSGHPADLNGKRTRVVVPADRIQHTFLSKRPAQRRGYTWGSAAILELNHLHRYVEAVEVASRASASKFMVIQQQQAEGYYGEDDEPGTLAQQAGTQPMTANAGEALVLDPGQTAEFIDPRFPANNHRDFLRTTIRNIATGLLVDYPTLGNDLEGVNFSSIRAGLLDVRDFWRILQRWFIHHFAQPVFEAWLHVALLTTLKDIDLSPAQIDQMAWRGRGWEWVDPLKDTQANVLKLQNGLTTYTDVLGSQGLDFEEVMLQWASEEKFIKALGLALGTDIRGIADTAEDDQQPEGGATGGGGSDSSRSLPSLPGIRLLGVEPRTPEEIAAAVEDYRIRSIRLELPAPEPEP